MEICKANVEEGALIKRFQIFPERGKLLGTYV